MCGQELSNEYLIAKIGVLCENWRPLRKLASFAKKGTNSKYVLALLACVDTAENGPFIIRDRKMGVHVTSGDEYNSLQHRFGPLYSHW